MDIPPMLEIHGHGRLISTSPLSLGCVGWIDSIVFSSHYGSIAVFDMSRFGFVFDDFVFEFGKRTISCVGISLDFVFFGAFSAVRRPFFVVFGDFEGNLFALIFCLFRERIESLLKTTSLLRINFRFSGSHSL